MRKVNSRTDISGERRYRPVLFLLGGVLLIFVLVLSAFLLVRYAGQASENRSVALINGEPVSVRELKQVMIDKRAGIYSYFKQKYNADDTEGFWTKSHNGEVPVEMLKKQALDECVRVKVQQLLAKQKGVVEHIDYRSFLESLEAENKRRKQAVEDNRVIYGPVEYGEREYFSYVFSNMVKELQNKLGEKDFFADDDQLISYYEAIKDRFYKKEDSIKVRKLSLQFTGNDGKVVESIRDTALKEMTGIKARLEKGEKMETIVIKKYKNLPFKLEISDQEFTQATSRYDSELYPKLKEEAKKLSLNLVSGVVEEGRTFSIVKCTGIKPGGYQGFSDVKDNVRLRYVENKYEELVSRLVEKAQMQVESGVYGSVTMD